MPTQLIKMPLFIQEWIGSWMGRGSSTEVFIIRNWILGIGISEFDI